VLAIFPDVADEDNVSCVTAAARVPAKRTRKVVETRDGLGAGDADVSVGVSVSELGGSEGADQFGRHVVVIPESVRADGSKTRARKRIVYTS
jgi:hypothetical protein